MRLKALAIFFFLGVTVGNSSFAQNGIETFLRVSDTLHKPKRNVVIVSESVLGSATLIGLSEVWYSDFRQSKFQTINDSNQWLQMDKFGHVFSSYQLGRFGAQALKWSGVNQKHQLLYGATLGLSFLTVVEVFDGFSEEWGFSWSDMGANAIGTGLYIGQELLWSEQRLLLKYSFHQTQYASQRPETLGGNFLEQVLKDYNGQTYWLSANLQSFLPNSNIPRWLNVALGYSVNGLLTGSDTKSAVEFLNQDRKRQLFISLDVDLTKIKTKSNTLKTLFNVMNCIKIPLPTVDFIGKNDIKFRAIYF